MNGIINNATWKGLYSGSLALRYSLNGKIIMRYTFLILITLTLFFTFGCAKEQVYENIYNGLQQSEQMRNSSDEPIPLEQPSYEEYKRERDKALPNKEKKNL